MLTNSSMPSARLNASDIYAPIANAFHQYGYVKLEGFFSAKQINRAYRAMNGLISSPARYQGNTLFLDELLDSQRPSNIHFNKDLHTLRHPYIIGDIASYSKSLRELVLDSNLFDLVQTIFACSATYHFAQCTIRQAKVGARLHWHHDRSNTYFYTKEHHTLRAMICLDGMAENQGCFEVIDGSHQWTDAEYAEWKSKQKPSKNTFSASNQDFKDASARHLAVNAGGLILFSPSIVHRAGFNTSQIDRRNIIIQFGRKQDVACLEELESITWLEQPKAKS